MKNPKIKFVLPILFAFLATFGFAQSAVEADSTGLPGDHFSLQGALELFKDSKSPEDFEKALNKEDNYVNNLDLNEDGDIDYIRVIDHVEGDAHAIVLQAPVSEKESQDIAVIEIERKGESSAVLQIVGDEDIYGEQTIIEPFEEEGKGGGAVVNKVSARLVVNVWSWRPVRFIYAPRYTVWVSPFRWGYYPSWWRPWRPHPWRWHFGRRVHYHHNYHVVKTHRVVTAHKIYTPRRTHSVTVKTRHAVSVNRYRTNKKTVVAKTKTTTVTKGNRSVKATKTTKSARAANGPRKVGASKTTTSVKATNGRKTVGAKRSTGTVRAQGNKRQIQAKRTTTKAGAKKGNKAVKGSKTTTKVKGKRRGGG